MNRKNQNYHQNRPGRGLRAGSIAARGISILLTVLTVIAGIILAAMIGFTVRELRDTDYNMFRGDRLKYRIEEGAYGYLVYSYYEDGMDYYEKEYDGETAALAAYIDSAMQYRAWSEGGMTNQAEAARARMEAAEEAMGLYTYEIPEIRRQTGLEDQEE